MKLKPPECATRPVPDTASRDVDSVPSWLPRKYESDHRFRGGLSAAIRTPTSATAATNLPDRPAAGAYRVGPGLVARLSVISRPSTMNVTVSG